jgi:hypothetical protein
MLRNKLVRSDGSIIDSSVIISCEYTEEVNCSTNLAFGDVTASELNVEIRSTEAIQQGEVLTYYMVEDGVETLIGEFITEKPTVASRSSIRFSAYDNISKTEKLFSEWLRDNQELFPMTPKDLLLNACSYCGVRYAGGDFPNQSITINAFYADNITCRQILSWVASLAGRFARATATGEIELAQYSEGVSANISYRSGYANPVHLVVTDTHGNVVITSDEMDVADDGYGNVIATINDIDVIDVDGNVTLATGFAIPYMQGTLSYETYQTDIIDRVQIKHSDNDVGVIYPPEVDGNCYAISQNMLLGTCSEEDVTAVAQTLYEQLRSMTYVPFSVTLPRTLKVRAGEIIAIRDVNGNAFVTLVMKMSVTPSGVTISSTGDKSYGSTAAVASEKFTNLTGKVLELSKSVDGLSLTNKDLAGRVGSLELTTEQFKTTVGKTYVTADDFAKYQQTVATSFTQTEESFEFKFDNTKNLIGNVDKDLQEKYNERTSYIRFEDGNIILGKNGSKILLIQKNDRISFVRNEKDLPEVAWFADDVLHVTEGEFTVQLGIGKFGFRPGANGNLSFRKVVD